MNEPQKNWTVISLGGSLVSPNKPDGEYVKTFVACITAEVARGGSVAVITGGGGVARDYRDALEVAGVNDPVALDWIGIAGTRFNAEFVRMAFGNSAEPVIFLDPRTLSLTGKNVLVGGGFRPGHSSDGSAVELARTLGAKKLVNLSNIDYVYTADPRTNPNATKIEKISWPDFRNILPKEWVPGANAPFDPVAAQMAQDLGLEVAVMNGKNLPNLENYFSGKEFIGTVIL